MEEKRETNEQKSCGNILGMKPDVFCTSLLVLMFLVAMVTSFVNMTIYENNIGVLSGCWFSRDEIIHIIGDLSNREDVRVNETTESLLLSICKQAKNKENSILSNEDQQVIEAVKNKIGEFEQVKNTINNFKLDIN